MEQSENKKVMEKQNNTKVSKKSNTVAKSKANTKKSTGTTASGKKNAVKPSADSGHKQNTDRESSKNIFEFKAESKRLLDLMINSVYTNKEIFLRELISNASDALDKLYFASLTDSQIKVDRQDLEIAIFRDKQNRCLRILDNGVGMTKEELDSNLGTIARSGSKAFKERMQSSESSNDGQEIDIIGQFGVGFYSAFMVADRVTVVSHTLNSKPHIWSSQGLDGYTLEEFDGELSQEYSKYLSGTEITLQLKKDDSDYKYDDLLDEYHLSQLIKKYSDYIRYPIKMTVTKSVKEGDEYKENQVVDTVNSMIPLWKKRKTEVASDSYNNFYAEKFHDFEPPLGVITAHIEGTREFDTLLFVPSNAPYNYYSKEYQKGLQLYASGVLITDCCQELLPDYFGFVKGIVDSADLSLNISREMLQQDRQLTAIAKDIEKLVKNELVKMQKEQRDKYDKFFKNFGLSLKFGAYDKFGQNKDNLKDLLMFYSSTQKKFTTLSEYVERMKLGQEYIYFASGDSVEKIDKLPSCELLKDKEYEILYFTDNVDEFVIKVLDEYNGKKFMSSSDPKLNFGDNAGDNAGFATKHKDLLDSLKELLKGKVEDVVISNRLKSHAVCLSAKGEISIEMEKTFSNIHGQEYLKSQKILEINPNHAVMNNLITHKDDNEYQAKMANVLYSAARLIEGLPIEDAVGFTEDLFKLLG